MTALTVDAFAVFAAVVVVVFITTIAIVVIANTADVDSMADPTPRLGEDDERSPELHRAKTAWFPDRSGWDQQ